MEVPPTAASSNMRKQGDSRIKTGKDFSAIVVGRGREEEEEEKGGGRFEAPLRQSNIHVLHFSRFKYSVSVDQVFFMLFSVR